MKSSRSLHVYLAIITYSCVACATDIYREPWHWREVPKAIVPPNAPPTAREPRAFEYLRLTPHTTMRQLVSRVGVPDAFAPQFCVTRNEGAPIDPKSARVEAGTFRYDLRGGGVALISVSDFHTIQAVIRFQRHEDNNVLYRRDEP